METWHYFAAMGVVLALVEIFTPTFFTMPAGLAFLATAAVGTMLDDTTLLFLVLAINLGVTYGVFYKFVWPRLQKSSPKTNADAMAGKIVTVSERIDPKTGEGYVKLYGDTWRVVAKDAFEVGDRVVITATVGNKVIVRAPLAEEEN